MRRCLLLLCAVGLAATSARAADAPPSAPAPPGALGPPSAATRVADVEADTTWSGEVHLDRRVRVLAGAVLRIARGTRVVVPWAAQRAVGDARPGIEVFGGLEADGGAEAPIRFEPASQPPGEPERLGTAWLGILVHPGSTLPARLLRCLVVGADTGFQPGRSDATARDCAFADCGTGIGVGALWEGPDRMVRHLREAAPRVEGCRFSRCYVGITVERAARPHVTRCVFHRCHTGIGNVRPGVTYPLEGLGPYVERCEFLRCGVAVQGASRVAHGIFERNDLVFLGSRFGEVHGTVIDRFVRGRNLYAGNQRLVRSDVPVGDDAILAAPVRRGALPDLLDPLDLLGPLEATLGLAPGSPGVGAAADGGDLGAFGAAGVTRAGAGLASSPPGLRVPRYLLLGPPSPGLLDALPVLAADVAQRARAAGDAEGDAVWAVLDGDDLEDDERSRRAAAQLPGTRVLLATLVAAEAGRASLRIGYDGALEAWWNGDPVATPPRARRFRPGDVILRVKVRKGPNALLLRHTPRATTARCVVRLLDEEGKGDAPGLAVAPVARGEKAPARAAVASATLTREKGRDGKPTGKAVLRIVLTGPVHWREVRDRRRYQLLDAKGAALDLADAPLQYRAAEKALVFTLPTAPPSGAWKLVVEGLRRPTGEAFADDRTTVTLRGP